MSDGPPLYDLRAMVRDAGWPDAQVTALRNTCLAAAATGTLPAAERACAATVAAALDGRAPGIRREHLELLARAGLTGLTGLDLPPEPDGGPGLPPWAAGRPLT